MSHFLPIHRTYSFFALGFLAFFFIDCAKLGEASVQLSEQNAIPAQLITNTTGVTKPGMGSNGGPITWSFWVKSRTAASDAMLGSFTPFYKMSATRLAVTQNFVLYRNSGSSTLLPFSVTRTGNLTNGSTTISGLSTTADLDISSNKKVKVKGTGIPAETYVTSIVDATTIQISKNATATSTQSLTLQGGATAILDTMEAAYAALKDVYGGGEHPYANAGSRIVILAYDIEDDYSTTGNYVGGYFSPRDLYSNDFTTALFSNPVAIQQYSNLIGTLGGYSNEMSIINYDLDPGYSTNAAQVNDIVIHELSHLFTYNRRVLTQRLTNHDLWIAEGIAENAPDQTQFAAGGSSHAVQQLRLTQLASPSTIDYYQDAPQMTDFLTWAPKIVGYLQSNLFFNFLRHRAEMKGGCTPATNLNCSGAMLTELMSTVDQTINGLEPIIKKYTDASGFAEIYGEFVLTHYLMMLGIPIDATNGLNGGAASQTRYSMSNVAIGNSAATVNGTTIKSKYSANVPYNYEGPKCADGTTGLKPNSYIIIRHRFDGGDKATSDTPGAGAVTGELPLKYVVNKRTENSLISGSPPATIALNTYDAGQNLPLSTFGWSLNDTVHIIIYNPNKTGSCRQFDPALILKRNHSKWVGAQTCPTYSYSTNASPDFDWQSDSGACWANNQDGRYNRPGGIAVYTGGTPPGSYATTNFIYVLDYNNVSLQRLDLEKGTAMGRLGTTETTCPTTGNQWDSNPSRFVNGNCAHHFAAPQGVYVDGSHTIYVADTDNRRIVKYDSAGNFTGWIGLNGTCSAGSWQGAGSVTDAETLRVGGAEFDPCMFWIPWAITSDGTDLFIVDNAKHRILRRNKTTGNYVSYLGNGQNAWNTSTSNIVGTLNGFAAGFFESPRGLTISGGNLYVADETNNRVVRISIASGNFTGWIGNGVNGWQTNWSATAAASSAVGYFRNPSAIATDDTYLYIADRRNNRIVRWNIATGNFAGWLGHGKVAWEMNAAAPGSDPYAGVSYYPPDYYAEPQGLAVAKASSKGTKRNYLFVTSVYNGRVTRVNLDCAADPVSPLPLDVCGPLYNPLTP